jgi:hypothetical protein
VFRRSIRLFPKKIFIYRSTLAPNKRGQRHAHNERYSKKSEIDRDGIVFKSCMRESIKGCLKEIEEAGETDD